MINLYLDSKMDRETWLRSALEGRQSVEGARFAADMDAFRGRAGTDRYRSEVDYDAVLRAHLGRR